MPRVLSEEIDAAVREVECLKAALSSSGEGGESYLGMRGHVQADRQALLQLLQLSLSSVDRLREKEIEVLKASTAAAAAAGQCARLGKTQLKKPASVISPLDYLCVWTAATMLKCVRSDHPVLRIVATALMSTYSSAPITVFRVCGVWVWLAEAGY